jgi:hypothetical protein
MEVIPLVIGANGTIPKYLRKYLSNILGNQEVTTATLSTAQILREVLM